jgi:HD-like signal output (HDOD) protein
MHNSHIPDHPYPRPGGLASHAEPGTARLLSLDELLSQPDALPAAPRLIQELTRSFDDPSASLRLIADKLALDPVLSARLLRLANSAYFHAPRTIGTVDDAVLMLGLGTVRTLVISSCTVASFCQIPGLDLPAFWRYSLHAAVGARWIAGRVGEAGDLAFAIGILHGVGQLILHTRAPESALRMDEAVSIYSPSRADAERAAFGFSHRDLSAELARRWEFPHVFTETLRGYGDTRKAVQSRMCGVLHLAVWRAQAEAVGLTEQQRGQEFPALVAMGMDMTPEIIQVGMPPLAELSEGLDELIA